MHSEDEPVDDPDDGTDEQVGCPDGWTGSTCETPTGYRQPCNPPTVSYAGHTYKTVQIGSQCWMAENLRYLPAVFWHRSAGPHALPHAWQRRGSGEWGQAAHCGMFAGAVCRQHVEERDRAGMPQGIMLAWGMNNGVLEAAARLRFMGVSDISFVRIKMVGEGYSGLGCSKGSTFVVPGEEEGLLTFVLPPTVQVEVRRTGAGAYTFDTCETATMNPGAKIDRVEWDFDFDGRFRATPGYCFRAEKAKEAPLLISYEFPFAGTGRVACKVFDSVGGEGLWIRDLEVN